MRLFRTEVLEAPFSSSAHTTDYPSDVPGNGGGYPVCHATLGRLDLIMHQPLRIRNSARCSFTEEREGRKTTDANRDAERKRSLPLTPATARPKDPGMITVGEVEGL